MRETVRDHYFVVGKLIGLVVFMGYEIVSFQGNMMEKSIMGMWLSFFIATTVLYELTENKTGQIIEIIAEGILVAIGVFLIPLVGSVLGMIWIADVCVFFKVSGKCYLFCFAPFFLYYLVSDNMLQGLLVNLIIVIGYFQEKVVIDSFRSIIGIEEETQKELKTDLEKQTKSHRQELKKSHLRFENQMLEDRDRISQALHDKLGHSINGSIYQLEAAKLLVEKKPKDCESILQKVIDQLRLSMDEIRVILRRERPDKRKMASLAILSLCEECETMYGIHTELNIEDEEGTIPDKVWEIILDNTYEAVTNALKYSNCHNIRIDIIAMNQVVRCTISDDGKGALEIEEGMGIAGMKNRVRAIKGYFDIESEVGFTINMILPFE